VSHHSAEKGRSNSANSLALYPIVLATLQPEFELGFDLYLKQQERSAPVLYRGQEYPLSREDLHHLAERGVTKLYTTRVGQARYEDYLRDHLDGMLLDESVAPDTRYHLLQECARVQIDTALHSVNVSKTMHVWQGVGQQLSTLLLHTDLLPEELFGMMRHDYYTFTHLLNVSTYAVVLAKALGIMDPDALQKIAVGGLLHDVGKQSMPATIINKKGPLSPQERDIMRRHPQIGFLHLRDCTELEWNQLMMVYQHHEAIDGSGYPVGIRGDEIVWEARLCAVVDVFDAMTCDRSYRRGLPVEEAVTFIETHSDKNFDREIARCWTKIVPTTPSFKS
jgi:putative nucleotidyltransferase with HDIG domain